MAASLPATCRRVILFDLDNTLYSFDRTNIHKMLRQNIHDVVRGALKLDDDAAAALENDYYARYGTTCCGLLNNHPELDIPDLCEKIHAVDIATAIPKPDAAIGAMLKELGRDGWDMWVFTNGEGGYAMRVLEAMGIKDAFRKPGGDAGENDRTNPCNGYKVIDCWQQWNATDKKNKPSVEAFAFASATANCDGADAVVVMVEDSLANLKVPAQRNWTPVWIGYGQALPEQAAADIAGCHTLAAVTDLPELLRSLHGSSN
jgi:pyrimidine 5'-nucleotidase